MKFLNVAFALARFVLIAALMPLAIGWRTPLFSSWRYAALAMLIILPSISIAFEFWMLRGTKAPQAAGKIHTDLAKGFIRAEVTAFDDLATAGTVKEVKARGLQRLEGKDQIPVETPRSEEYYCSVVSSV